MPFVQGKCENCGGILTVDPNLKAANCPFCGVAYVVQDSINNYNTTVNVGNVENMHADVVNLFDESSSEGKLKAANAYLKLGKYEQAYFEYKKVTELAPQNYLGWLGLIESSTNNYTKRIRSSRDLSNLKDYAKSVLTLAPLGKGEVILEKFTHYVDAEEEKNNTEKKQIELELTEPEKEFKQLEEIVSSLQSDISRNESRITALKMHNNSGASAFFIITGIIIFAFGLLLVNLFVKDSGWNESTIQIIAPIMITGIFFFIVGVMLIIKTKKHEKELVMLTSQQEKIKKELIIKDEKKKSVNDILMKIQEKYSVYN